MSTRYIRDLGPKASDSAWRNAQTALARSETRIGHIDTGMFPHPALGYVGQTAPTNILINEGRNVFDNAAKGPLPITDLVKGTGKIAQASEFPDHGVKTLSVILSNNRTELVGVAPGAKIVPYRVANGPIFVGETSTKGIGLAMDHALDLPIPPRVFSISMGNPGVTGLFELLRGITGGHPGMAKETTDAINRAYEAGVIIVCAGG